MRRQRRRSTRRMNHIIAGWFLWELGLWDDCWHWCWVATVPSSTLFSYLTLWLSFSSRYPISSGRSPPSNEHFAYLAQLLKWFHRRDPRVWKHRLAWPSWKSTQTWRSACLRASPDIWRPEVSLESRPDQPHSYPYQKRFASPVGNGFFKVWTLGMGSLRELSN